MAGSPAGARRELTIVVLLTVIGGAIVLLASGRAWARVAVAIPDAPQAPQIAALSGRTLAPLVAALGVAVLAAAVALVATRGMWRVVVGALIAVAGALIIGTTALLSATDVRSSSALQSRIGSAALHDSRITVELRAWRHVAAAGGLVIVAAGLFTAARGRTWAEMGRRFDAPTAVVAEAPVTPDAPDQPTDLELWEQLERGEDPTG
jgi:uncharacterized membrane protein (TIGR02234 family)